ncbi:MAG: epoxide hydrolase family protein [Gemmatimonadaceae bacterium]
MLVPRFHIDIEQSVLDDLAVRLEQTRFAHVRGSGGWDYGTSPEYVQELVEHWRTKYDWRLHEDELNRLTQYKAPLAGNDIHFIHECGHGADALPLLLLHGWPDSFYRYHKVIEGLRNPLMDGTSSTEAFDVVVPSLPGFAFTGPPINPDVAQPTRHTAQLLWELMTETLGYKRFAVAGGDTGSAIAQAMALDHPESIIAVHLTDIGWQATNVEPATLTKPEQKYLQAVQKQFLADNAYIMLQTTKPFTLAAALNDSPAGLASWIVDRFHSWGDHNGNIYNSFTQDELLTNIMLYWVTGTIGSSMYTYFAEAKSPSISRHEFVERPVGLALFPKDIGGIPPRALAERTLNVQRWSEMPHGGHFAAMEVPELYVNELREFLRPFRANALSVSETASRSDSVPTRAT